MTTSQQEADQINIFVDQINVYIIQMRDGIKRVSPRIKKLHEAGFNIESVMVNSQIIEHAIKLVLRAYKMKREVLRTLGKTDPLGHIGLGDKVFDQPLGPSIGKLKQFIGNTSVVIIMLENFKNKFRDDFVHNVFFTNDDNLKVREKESNDYLNSKEFLKMAIELALELKKVQKETHELYKDYLGK